MRRLLASFALLAAAPAYAQTLPQVDPRAAESCDVADGWIVVMKDWIAARNTAEETGVLKGQAATDLNAWFADAEKRILAGTDVKILCREAIAHRVAHGF